MRKGLLLVVCSLWLAVGWAQQDSVPIIPRPQLIEFNAYKPKLVVWINFNSFFRDSAGFFSNEIAVFNKQFKILKGWSIPTDTIIGFRFGDIMRSYIVPVFIENNGKPAGSYEIRMRQDQITILGDREGIQNGLSSLLQLCGAVKTPYPSFRLMTIEDSPRYQWRGMHLDVCRHFFTKAEVEKYIDYLALYKFNVFHWHLCDDQGWRIEIKKYPKLTEVGSIRKQTMIGKPSKDQKFDGKPYGGFYTQEDIKEIVAYATARHITVVPEIEMPGHALAALAAYPQYSCNGKLLEVGTTWGVFDDVYCAGNDSTFAFLQDVLSEVCELFPGKYIHIGGDECPKERWKTCPKCQKRIKDEKLKDERELQSYFIQRMEKFVNSKGKQIIGWDEILEGGLAPNASVMSWRGTQGGIDAAKQHHYVVMTPGKPCYFDHYQSRDKLKEPIAIGGFNPLDSVYKYEPMPKQLDPQEQQYILGAQGNVWTEYITTFKQVEYMAVPRMCALSEVLWTDPKNKNYKDFVARLKLHSVMLDKMGVNYAKHFKSK